jgi:phosphatidylglycerol:prolipoprotein diacylglycerol transferase
MRPTLLAWGSIRIASYPALLYVGLLAGAYATYAAGRAEGLDGDALAPAILALISVAVLGARLAFVTGRWRIFLRQPQRIIARGVEGGAVAYGALVAVPLSLPLLAALRLSIGSFWDAGAIGFLAAIVCLRVGCLLNGCCCGRATSRRFGLVVCDLAGRRARRIPTQLLEAALAAALLAAAAFAIGRMPFAGALFLLLLGAYALGRLALDFSREQAPTLGPLTVAQAFSAVFVVVSLCAFAVALLD